MEFHQICPRCGQTHLNLESAELQEWSAFSPNKFTTVIFTHFAACPITSEPILFSASKEWREKTLVAREISLAC